LLSLLTTKIDGGDNGDSGSSCAARVSRPLSPGRDGGDGGTLEPLTDLPCPGSGIRWCMTKPKPKDQLQKRGRKSLFREEFILIARAAARFGATEDENADELKNFRRDIG
jgi:hypothetical protein